MKFSIGFRDIGIHIDDVGTVKYYGANYGYMYLVIAVISAITLGSYYSGVTPLFVAIPQIIITALYMLKCNIGIYAARPSFQSPLDFSHFNEMHSNEKVHPEIARISLKSINEPSKIPNGIAPVFTNSTNTLALADNIKAILSSSVIAQAKPK